MRDLGKSGLQIDQIAEESERWAALIRGSGADSIVVWGDSDSERSLLLNGDYDRVLT